MFLTLGENISTQPLSEVSFKFASFFHFPRCRYAKYFACPFHFIELRRARLALCRKPSLLENNSTTKMLMRLDSHFSAKKNIFARGTIGKNLVSKFKMPNVENPTWYSTIKAWSLHSALELDTFLRRSYFFRSKTG